MQAGGGDLVKATPRLLNPQHKRSGAHFTGGWVVLWASLGGTGQSRRHRGPNLAPYMTYSNVFVFECEFDILGEDYSRMFEKRVLI